MRSFTEQLLDKMRSVRGVGNLLAKGNERKRAAFDIAVQRVNDRVIHTAMPTGAEEGHGQRESYPGLTEFGSAAHIRILTVEMETLEKENPQQLDRIAQQRGYYNHDYQGPHGLKYLNGVEQEYTTATYWDAHNRPYDVSHPILGGGEALKSKYHDVPVANSASKTMYGGGTAQTESRFSNVPQAPRLPNGELDLRKIEEYHQSPKASARSGGGISVGKYADTPTAPLTAEGNPDWAAISEYHNRSR
jgi:hypothetical protein